MIDIICRPAENEQEIRQCFIIRKTVFVEDQGLFEESDRDEKDNKSIHIIALHADKIIGTVRVYMEDDDIWWGGRLAVLKRFRGKAGRLLIIKAVEIVREKKAKHFFANVQQKNVPFFKTLKWKPAGQVFFHYDEPHQLMEAELN